MDVKKLINKGVKNPKKLMMNMIVLMLIGVLLILVGDITGSLTAKKAKEKKNVVEVNSNAKVTIAKETYEEKIEHELSNTLSKIEGVGKLSVMIYFSTQSQSLPAMNSNNDIKKTEENDNQGGKRITTENSKSQNVVLVTRNGESTPYIVKEINPTIGGVVIVAEGAQNSLIKERLLWAAKTVLNIPANKVSVLPMKK